MKTFYAHEPHVDGTKTYAVGDKRDADENEVQHLVELKVLGEKPPKGAKAEKAGDDTPDYERDDLGKLDLKKANKNQLLVIAAYEKAEVAADATIADLIKAIEAKRVAA